MMSFAVLRHGFLRLCREHRSAGNATLLRRCQWELAYIRVERKGG
jgi:hypothetical protein